MAIAGDTTEQATAAPRQASRNAPARQAAVLLQHYAAQPALTRHVGGLSVFLLVRT